VLRIVATEIAPQQCPVLSDRLSIRTEARLVKLPEIVSSPHSGETE
jgi:hypothetical protein